MAENRRLVGDASNVRDARALVRSVMSGQSAEARDVAVLLTDELVTNAVVHGGGRFVLSAELGDTSLRVVVGDPSPATPKVLAPSAEQEHGRGMAIVASLATDWGTDPEGAGKEVWFTLDLPGR
ncbi:MAG TPA: ATP-binding protein [Acidimicrobiales bacterium]|nr:ATP-binding protein [Acidimicrobiales bacterium]